MRLREPLEIWTIQHEKYFKLTSEFEYNGLKLPMTIGSCAFTGHIEK